MILLWMFAAWAGGATSLGWTDLPAAVDAAWATGGGAAWDARVDGASDARRAEPLPFQNLQLQWAPDARSGSVFGDTQATVQFGVGDRLGSRRAMWAGEGALREAQAAVQHQLMTEAVQATWLDGWLALALAEHLQEHSDGLAVELDRLREAAARGALPRTVVDDLSVELGRLRAESAAELQRVELARVRLASLLGAAVDIAPVGIARLEEDVVEVPEGPNPWAGLADHVESFPQVRLLDASIAAAQARARALRWDTPGQIGAGVQVRVAPDGSTYAVPLVIGTVPFGNASAPEARDAAAAATALEAERAFAVAQLRATVAAEGAALDAALARHAVLAAGVEAPMRERLDRLSAGLRTGASTVEAVLLARRDLHEAFHARAAALADVLVRRARGLALLDLVSKETP